MMLKHKPGDQVKHKLGLNLVIRKLLPPEAEEKTFYDAVYLKDGIFVDYFLEESEIE